MLDRYVCVNYVGNRGLFGGDRSYTIGDTMIICLKR